MTTPSREYMSVTAAANYLDCHPLTIRRMFDDNRLTKYQLGGLIRVDRNELDERMATS